MSKVAVLYNQPEQGASLDDLDVLHEVELVVAALAELGYEVVKVPFFPDLSYLRRALGNAGISFVFNLVEAVEGKGRYSYLVPAMLEMLGLEYCGCGPFAFMMASNKVMAKQLMQANAIPTAPWCTEENLERFKPHTRYILKCVDEDASIGMDDDSLLMAESREHLREALRERKERKAHCFFAEEFLDGREFDIGIVGPHQSPHLLPVVERTFHQFQEQGKPRICNYAAKWDKTSFEYKNIERRPLPEPDSAKLRERIVELGLQCWNLFRGEGFMRLDMRSDSDGNCYVIDVNPNPCLAADSTLVFSATLLDRYSELIRRIVDARHR